MRLPLGRRVLGISRCGRSRSSPPSCGRSRFAIATVLWFTCFSACDPAGDDSLPRDARPNIILISVDTLRADHLGSYGYERATSPAVDSLARDGVLFAYANVAIPKTSPSLFSLLSGLYPKSHGVHELGMRISDSIPLLPEVLRRHGYRTAGIVGQWNCHRQFGFDRGFDFYDDDFSLVHPASPSAQDERHGELRPAKFNEGYERRAELIIDRSIEWLADLDSQPGASPFFLWMHLMDPHAAYDPPAAYEGRFTGVSPMSGNSFWGDSLRPDQIHVQAYVPGNTNYDDYINRYDAEIAYVDDQLERIFEYLREHGLYRDALVIFTSDHGEYMGENLGSDSYFLHGVTPYEPETRVPLIVKFPANAFGGKAVSQPVSLVDVLPSLLEVIGDDSMHVDGGSLLALIEGSEVDSDAAVFVQVRHGDRLVVRKGEHKLIARSEVDVPALVEEIRGRRTLPLTYHLFNVVSDPLERRDLSSERPELRAQLIAALEAWLAAPSPIPQRPATNLLDPETAMHLRALGYVEEADAANATDAASQR